ncbi:hypothetical protein KC19_12G010600 [Ceratodon purpureus]|uniref:Uncharacterized protein n=1 Tax=Ceratodon purpureus TaxID=3225 RepID=A0A8T0G277_CERPU|nr:hypothetical protein KC19_12G010600 [Ceratodon purpureus]
MERGREREGDTDRGRDRVTQRDEHFGQGLKVKEREESLDAMQCKNILLPHDHCYNMRDCDCSNMNHSINPAGVLLFSQQKQMHNLYSTLPLCCSLDSQLWCPPNCSPPLVYSYSPCPAIVLSV